MEGRDTWVKDVSQIPKGKLDEQWEEDIGQMATYRSFSKLQRKLIRQEGIKKIRDCYKIASEKPWEGLDNFQLNVNFFREVMKLPEMKNFKDKKVIEEIAKGFSVTGDSEKSGYWKLKKLKTLKKITKGMKRRKLTKLPWKFMSVDTLDTIYKKVKAEEASGRYKEITKEEIEEEEIILDIFGVLQDVKTRKVVNAKPLNEFCRLQETVLLPSVHRVIQKIRVGMADKEKLVQNIDSLKIRSKQEVIHQIQKELAETKGQDIDDGSFYEGPGYWWREKDIYTIICEDGIYVVGTEDLSDAYRYVPLRIGQTVVIRAWNGTEWRYYRSYAMVMGCMNSVNNFQRISNMISVMLFNILLIPNQFYLDDLIFMVTSDELKEASDMAKEVIHLTGFKLSDKSQIGKVKTDVLGFTFEKITDNEMVGFNVNLKEGKLQKIEKIQEKLRLEKEPLKFFTLLEKLIGYFSFLRLVMDKRVDPLTSGLYSFWTTESRYHMLKQESYRNLALLNIKAIVELLKNNKGIDIKKGDLVKKKVTIFSDATMVQGGYMIMDEHKKLITSSTMKFSLLAKVVSEEWKLHVQNNAIRDWELFTIVIAIINEIDNFKGKEVTILADNIEVIWGFNKLKYKSYRKRSMLLFVKMIGLLSNLCDKYDIDIVYRYVNTVRNPADALTRDEWLLGLKDKFGIKEIKELGIEEFQNFVKYLGLCSWEVNEKFVI